MKGVVLQICTYVRSSFTHSQFRDIKQVESFFRNQDFLYGSLTIYLTVQPAILAAISNRNPRELFLHLPFIHLKKHWKYWREINEAHANVIYNPDDDGYASTLLRKESEFQEVKIFTAMGESAPQFILAIFIAIKQGESLDKWILNLNPVKNPIEFTQMSTSLASTVLAVTGLFTDLECFINFIFIWPFLLWPFLLSQRPSRKILQP